MAAKLPKALTKTEVQTILQGINRHCPTGCRNYAILKTMYRAGLRVSEICNLTPADIKLNDRILMVQQGKGKKDRNLYINNSLFEALSKWQKIRPESPYFFSTLQGKKLSDRYLREVCYRLSEKTGVYLQDGEVQKPVSNHTFRHSFATTLIEDGFNLREIQRMLGHSSLNTTEAYLTVFDPELKEKIINWE